jgi:hypothetical protein
MFVSIQIETYSKFSFTESDLWNGHVHQHDDACCYPDCMFNDTKTKYVVHQEIV